MTTFDELLENAIRFEIIERPKNEFDKASSRSYYDGQFTLWLQRNKGLKYDDESHYNSLLTVPNFKEFISDDNKLRDEALRKHEKEKQVCRVYPPIPALKYNSATLPQSIFEYFRSLGDHRSFTARKGEPTVYGKLMPPFYKNYVVEEGGIHYNFFTLEKYSNLFDHRVESGQLYDKNGVALNRATAWTYLVEYAKGFEFGYHDFNETIAASNGLFPPSSADLAYKIFERVYPELMVKTGNISVTQYNINTEQDYITNELFFVAGKEGGEYYKAWEIILSNPLTFQSFFEKIHSQQVSTPKPESAQKKEDNGNVLLPKYREFIWTLENFFNEISLPLGQDDFSSLHKIGQKVKTEIFDLTHQAKLEVQDFLLKNPQSRPELRVMFAREIKVLCDSDNCYRKEYELTHVKNARKISSYFSIVEELRSFKEFLESRQLFDDQSQTIPTTSKKFTLGQVALIFIYRRILIVDPRTDPERKANTIAKDYGFTSPTSGQQLFDKFKSLDGGSQQRTGVADKGRMIKNIQSVLSELTPEEKGRAQIELNTLQQSINNA